MELNRGGTAEEVIREGDPKDMIDVLDIVALYSFTRREARILLFRRGENAERGVHPAAFDRYFRRNQTHFHTA